MHAPVVDFSAFLFGFLVLMVAAKIGAEIAERCGQPSVLGEICAGIIVGATGLCLITRGGDAASFNVLGLRGEGAQGTFEALDVVAEIGVIILLFEIGLHSDLYELRKVGKSALWVGTAGVVLPFVGGWFAAQHMLHFEPFPSLFIGAALTATSVGITARVFHDLKLLHTRESQVVLGAAVADDVIGLVILAVVVALGERARSGATAINGSGIWVQGASVLFVAVAFLGLALYVGVKCVPLLQRACDGMRSRGGVTVTAFAFCLLMALLSKQAQLAPIVGAFAGGLVLSHSKRIKDIQTAMKPVADIFVPFFFAMMGTAVNLRSLLHSPEVLTIGGLLIVVAIIGKVLGCMTVPDANLSKLTVGLAMIPRGEVGLIYARLGVQHDWLKGNAYDGIVLTVMATTLITPPLLRLAGMRLKRERGEAYDVGTAEKRHDLAREDWETFEVDEMLATTSGDGGLTPVDGAPAAVTPARGGDGTPLHAI